jgi:hypothetical protein
MTRWGCWVPYVHANCNHNETVALLKRSLGPTPEPADGCSALKPAFKRLARVASRYGGDKWDYLETAKSYTGALRRRYLEAERSLREDGRLSSSDYLLKAFLKAEKLGEKVAKPRLIFPRSPRYCLALASWLKPFEHWLWGNLQSVGTRGVKKTRVVAKGLNAVERANLIRRKMRHVRDCVVFEVDGKAFEAHQGVEQLRLEHTIYGAAYPGATDLQRLLAVQLKMCGKTAGGVRFEREGGRASGDFNTGMGTTLVMLSVVDTVMRLTGARQYDCLVDGDNALIFLRRADVPLVVPRFHDLAKHVSGHEMVLERPVDYFEGVRFGQSQPVLADGKWRMVRDWRKVLSGGTASHRWLNEPRFAREYLRGVGICESHLNRGVPILGKWAETLLTRTEIGRSVRMEPHRDYQVLGVRFEGLEAGQYRPPTREARETFARAFGVEPELQVEIEAWLARGQALVVPVQPLEPSREFPDPYCQADDW